MGEHLASLAAIGLEPADCGIVRRLLGGPGGLVLLAGPEGAGLRTTAAAMLRERAGAGRAGAGAGAGIHYLPRLEGPRRLARAVRAAERGALVIGIVRHPCACAVPALARAWGVAPARLAESLVFVLAQRLVPALCPHCSRDDPGDDARRALAAAMSTWLANRPAQARRQAPGGCDSCATRGLRGRVLVYELMEADLRARSLIASGVEGPDLENALLGGGRTLWDSGLRQLAAGRTSVELLRGCIREPR